VEYVLQFFRRWPALRNASLLSGSLFLLIGLFLLPLVYLLGVSFPARSPYGTFRPARSATLLLKQCADFYYLAPRAD
jgi:hypothetical protein